MKNLINQMADADYQYNEWEATNRERVSSKTQDSTIVLTELFKSFGEIFGAKNETDEARGI